MQCSNRPNREKDKGYRIPAILSRAYTKRQALSVERLATWLARIRRENLALLELSHQSTDEMLDMADAFYNVEETRVKDCQTKITSDYITGLERENASLKEKLKLNSLNEDSFRETTIRVLFYTGLLRWSILLCFV